MGELGATIAVVSKGMRLGGTNKERTDFTGN